MLKSTLVIMISALTLKSTRALLALAFLCALAVAGVIHLLTHDHIASTRALRDLAILDMVGSVSYVVGVAVFG